MLAESAGKFRPGRPPGAAAVNTLQRNDFWHLVLGLAPDDEQMGPGLSCATAEQPEHVLIGRNQQQILLRLIVDIGSDLDVDATLNRVIAAAIELTGAHFCALGIRGADDTVVSSVHAGIEEFAAFGIGDHVGVEGILGLLFSGSGATRLDCAPSRPAASGFPGHRVPPCSLLGVPIIIRHDVFGSLYLTKPASLPPFSEADEVAVLTLAAAAALAIDNARHFDKFRSTAHWTAASQAITDALLLGGDLKSWPLQLIADRVCALTQAEQAIVLVPSDADLPIDEVDTLMVSNVAGLRADDVLGQRVPVDGSTTGAVFRSGTPVLTDVFGHPIRAFTDVGRRPTIVAPLGSEHTLLGVIAVARSSGQPPFDAEHLSLMTDFASHAAAALTSAGALEQAHHLTVLADRDRIAHDLHDHVIQRLFAAGMDLQGTIARSRSSEITSRLNRTVTDLQTTIEDIRTAIFELHPTGTGRIGFRQRVQAAVADLTERRDIGTTLRLSGPMSVIGDELAGHAESVIMEAISNAVRHSGATQLTVDVAVADELVITVTDDGCGISADSDRRSGLANMVTRAEQLGGYCHLATPTGGGTEVRWTAPLPNL
ncbi:GAF domain-containing sensor histidine kinase [Mycolicibacterium sp. CR10]|uniref:sensor histidine kinase n=1 Tax=Mycolicibacterium sp. CR10 TaxID=2562314 RepID=UPI001F1063D0|nr:GAF domain-containing sensor histidine kinase [Mycolicibacterium sp. CR10]